MAAQVLNMESDAPEIVGRWRLDGRIFGLRLHWSDCAQRWLADLSDRDGSQLWTGRTVAAGVDLNRASVGPEYPPGALVAIDSSGAKLDPGRRDLGSARRVPLIYVPAEDLP